MSWRGTVNTVRNFFSEVFKRHTEDDAEQVVIVGAIGTIPNPDTLTSQCPRPWLYTRVFMFFMLVMALLFVPNMLTNSGQVSKPNRGQSWCAVELEVGYNEIGDADEAQPDSRRQERGFALGAGGGGEGRADGMAI